MWFIKGDTRCLDYSENRIRCIPGQGLQYLSWISGGALVSLRVQVRNDHILTQNLYYNYYYLIPKYLLIGYLDP